MKCSIRELLSRLRFQHVLLVLPLITGMIGFYILENQPFLQALFNCVSTYILNYSDVPANLWIEVTRWVAPVATASGVLLAISALGEKWHNFLARCTGQSVAVYGPVETKAPLLAELGARGIDMGEKLICADSYILLGEESENLDLYHRNEDQLKDHEVYLKCQSIPAQASASARLHLFCPEETAARLFWKECCPYATSARHSHTMDIVLLGFGKLGRELLLAALQSNLFHPGQKISYHIFGPEDGFSAIHSQLGQISDPVIFHPEPWYDQLPLLEQAGMVVVVEQQEQLALLEKLLMALLRRDIHVFTANHYGPQILEGRERLILFPWAQKSMALENLQATGLTERAKRIHRNYSRNFASAEADWQQQSAFIRYSNLSATNYREIQRIMLAQEGITPPLDEQWLDRLAELEHIRWCRYHYLNNWRLGTPENGKHKDPDARLHTALIPYADLSELEKDKDRENVKMLFSMDAQQL